MSKRTKHISTTFLALGVSVTVLSGCKREYNSYAECVADNPDAALCGEQHAGSSAVGYVPHSTYVPMYRSSSGSGYTTSYSESSAAASESVSRGGFGESAHASGGGE